MTAVQLKSRHWLDYVLIGLAVVVTARCAPLPTATVSAVPLPSVVWHKEIATFTDPVLGLILDIPSNWQISPRLGPPTASNPSTFGTSIPRIYEIDLRPHSTQIQITPGPSPVHTLEEIRQSSVLSGVAVLEEREIDLHGLPALWIETEMEMPGTGEEYPVVQLFVLINDHSVRLTVYGDPFPAIDTINSIRSVQDGSATITPTSEEAILPSVTWQSETATFTDPVLGFSLDVPSNWLIYPRLEPPSSTNRSTFESPCFNGAPVPLTPCTQLTVNWLPTLHSFDDVRESLSQYEYAEKPVVRVVAERELDLHGWAALWVETEEYFIDTDAVYPAIRVYISLNGRMMLLQANGELGPVADIVNSIRPIESMSADSQ